MGIRQLVPASSRSFWQLYNEVESLRTEVHSLRNMLKTHDEQMKLLAWETLRKEGELPEETKKRFFLNMAPATGGLRLFQLGNAKLLEEFDALCSQNNLPYWIAFGTLLGAVRHHGFIPWDDDTDLCMMRQDIDALIKLVENSDRYRVAVAYDYWSYCKQVRFRYKDESIPCFLDLFIFDYVTDANPEVFQTMNTMRGQMIEAIKQNNSLDFWNEENAVIDAKSHDAAPLVEFFDSAIEKEYALIPELTVDKADAQGVLWGMDNVYDFNKYEWCCKKEDIFPLARLEFEGVSCNAPANYMKFIEEVYGDYLSIPLKSNTYEHVPSSVLEAPETKGAIKSIL